MNKLDLMKSTVEYLNIRIMEMNDSISRLLDKEKEQGSLSGADLGMLNSLWNELDIYRHVHSVTLTEIKLEV